MLLCYAGFTHKCEVELNDIGMTLDCGLYPDKSVYPDTMCISSPHSPLPPPGAPVNRPQCEPMKHRFCTPLYNETVIPNLIGQSSQVYSKSFASI